MELSQKPSQPEVVVGDLTEELTRKVIETSEPLKKKTVDTVVGKVKLAGVKTKPKKFSKGMLQCCIL